MNKRVFHIDQECFILYVEDLSTVKERFLRIGNSSFLKSFGKQLTFITLLSKIYLGNPFLELEIFRPNKYKKIIGEKEIAKSFLDFLKNHKININKVVTIYAEEKGEWFKEIKSEKDFLKQIETDKSKAGHSFASFYNDGNIRIFNRSEIIFDLKVRLAEIIDEQKELIQLSTFFSKNYQNAYKKPGIIHSNNSLFIFSNNKIACFSDSSTWIKDAIRVGINPLNVDLVHLANNEFPDSMFVKLLLIKQKDNKTLNLLSNELKWVSLFSEDFINYINLSDSPNTEYKIGEIKLIFNIDKINIIYKNFELTLNPEESYLDAGKTISGEYSDTNEKNSFKLLIDAYENDSLTLLTCNPLIFQDKIEDNNYISNFWNNVSNDKKSSFLNDILLNDSDYKQDFIPSSKAKNFYSRLLAETIRRINIEANNELDESIQDNYKNMLKGFSGLEINKNNLVIQQILGNISNIKHIGIRDVLLSKDLYYLEDDSNPFLYFQKDLNKKEWEQIQKNYRDKFKKNIVNNDILKLINNRFSNVLLDKQFYIEEQERLKRFIEQVIINEKRISKSIENKNNNIGKEKADDLQKHSTIQSHDKIKNALKGNKKFFAIFIPIIILLLLIIGALFLLPQIKSIFPELNKILNKNYIADNTSDSNSSTDKVYIRGNTKSNIKSISYKYYMTKLDLYILTNRVAIKNNYYRMMDVYPPEYDPTKNPNLIYPGNILILPDSKKIIVKDNDTMWDICEIFLINQINQHEIKINKLIEKVKNNEINLVEFTEELKLIKKESFSEMLRDLLDKMINVKNIDELDFIVKRLK